VALLANLGDPGEAAGAVAAGAEGVGLFRTEFLFLDAHAAPTAADQEKVYLEVLGAFAGRKVVVRVLDAGADKPLAFLDVGTEPNPALGVRGLRALRVHPDVLDTQLAALASAAAATGADVWVMAPMVSDATDAAWFVARARAHGLATAGAMIEVPAAAITADAVLRAVSFASIGTNDLAQYALAADRQVGALAPLQDPWHPAVLRLVQLVGAAGALAAKPIGVCGEAAADPLLACVLVGLGVTSLSMVPAALADVRVELARRSYPECVRFAQLALAATTAAEARTRVHDAAA
jgi:phosphotransferase system enzyme I (PtsI)